MTLVLAWMRLDLRRRWRSLVVLALLIAVSAGTVLTAVAGARRGTSAVDRLLEVTLPATAFVLPDQPGFDWAAIRALPEVEAMTWAPVESSYVRVDGIPQEAVSSPFDAAAMHSLERPVVLAGRLTDPTRADEAVVTPVFVDRFGLGVGDTVTARVSTPATSPGEPATPIRIRIVGVVRSLLFSDVVFDAMMVPSAGLLTDDDGGVDVRTYALVRLRGGEADLPALRADLARVSGRSDFDVLNVPENARAAQKLSTFESAGLLAFGLAALVTAMVLIGQAVARYIAATVADLRLLRAVGITRRQAVLAGTVGPGLAALAGTGLGVAAAVVASSWMPFGVAALLEPRPGIDVDWLVLGPGGTALMLAVIGAAAAAAWLATATGRSATSSRRSATARAVSKVGLPVPVVVGTRFALEPGRGRSAVPVRGPALGAVTGVLSVLVAFTFADGVADAVDTPSQFGRTYQLEGLFGRDGQDWVPTKPVLAAIAADSAVLGTNDALVSVAESRDAPIPMSTHDPVGAPIPTVLTRGRLPSTADEVALAPTSARLIGADMGSSIELTGSTVTRRLTVTGIGAVPAVRNDYGEGGWLTPAGFAALFDGYQLHTAQIALRPGVDPTAIIPRLSRAAGAAVGTESVALKLKPPPLPRALALFRFVVALPLVLSGFLVLLAVGAVGHALATAVRRRRHEMAVLRTLGMTRWQTRGVVVTQASVLAGIGLLFGVPLGVALGRMLWRAVADVTFLQYVPPVAFWALVLVVPVTLLVANLLAWPPAQRAARLRIGHVLRTE